MVRIVVSVTIDAAPPIVWSAVRDIATHTDWMADAVAIRFTSSTATGVGTTFDCDTKVGPLRLTDKMEVTDWIEERAMGIRHVGVVTGTGRFSLALTDLGHTRFTWDEELVFPWWMGGPIGGAVGGPLLKAVWKRNLRSLKALVESGSAVDQSTLPTRER